jgi:hypothetical protein
MTNAAKQEVADANDRLERLRDEAQASHQFDYRISIRVVDRNWSNRLNVISDHRGPAWDVMYQVAADVMDAFGLHGPFGNPEETADLETAINHIESMTQGRGGNFYYRRYKR